MGVASSRGRLERIPAGTEDVSRPPLYLPDVRYVRLVTLGFDTAVSKILWFHTINYFGRELTSRQDYRWLGNMCTLVTTLDPKARHAFEFCATLLSWVARKPQQALALLNAAVAAEPDYWRYLYLRGFTSYYFLHDFESATKDFHTAAHLPGTPPHVATYASALLVDRDGPEMAIRFLKDLISRTPDPAVREKLDRQYRRAILAKHLQMLSDARARYTEQRGTAPQTIHDLISAGLVAREPEEPFGGSYTIDPSTGEPGTTSGKKPLRFAGKTVETGFAAKEWQQQDEEDADER